MFLILNAVRIIAQNTETDEKIKNLNYFNKDYIRTIKK